jgi:hypothetical protein
MNEFNFKAGAPGSARFQRSPRSVGSCLNEFILIRVVRKPDRTSGPTRRPGGPLLESETLRFRYFLFLLVVLVAPLILPVDALLDLWCRLWCFLWCLPPLVFPPELLVIVDDDDDFGADFVFLF